MNSDETGEKERFYYSEMQQDGQTGAENAATVLNTSMDNRSDESNEVSEKSAENERFFLQYRSSKELYNSDEDSDFSADLDIVELLRDIERNDLDHERNYRDNNEHFNSLSDTHDYKGNSSSLLTLHESLRYCNDEIAVHGTYNDVTRRLNKIILNASPRSTENGPEKLQLSSDSENKLKTMSSTLTPESVNCHTEDLQSTMIREDKTQMSPQSIFRSHFPDFNSLTNSNLLTWKSCASLNIGTCSMISSPISSNCINLEDTQTQSNPLNINFSSADEKHTSVAYSPAISRPERKLSSTGERHNSSKSKIDQNYFSRSYEFSGTLIHHHHQSDKEYKQSNSCTSPISSKVNPPEVFNSSNSKIIHENLSCYSELPSTSKQTSRYSRECQNSNECNSSSNKNNSRKIDIKNSKFFPEKFSDAWEFSSTVYHKIPCAKDSQPYRASTSPYRININKNECFASNLPSTSKRTPERLSPQTHNPPHAIKCCPNLNFGSFGVSSDGSKQITSPQLSEIHHPPLNRKCFRKLNFDDFDLSNDESKWRLLEMKERRKRRKSFPLNESESHGNNSKIPKIQVHSSENSHASNQNSGEIPLNLKENEIENNVLRPLGIVNCGNFEQSQSCRKRLVSDSKVTDILKYGGETRSGRNKKLKSSE